MTNNSAFFGLLCLILASTMMVTLLYLVLAPGKKSGRAGRPRQRSTVWRCDDCGAYNSSDREYCSKCGRFYYEDIDQLFDMEEDEF